MISCKVCGHQEYHGSFFCGECGSQLIYQIDELVNTLVYPAQNQGIPIDLSNTIPKEILETKVFLLYDPTKEEIVNIPDQMEFTLGRVVDGQVITPDVDLNPFNAFDKGVSRLHATIRINEDSDKVFVIDLGSANGSKVNGYEIPSNSEVPLNHSDLLTLGKLNLKVILPKELKG